MAQVDEAALVDEVLLSLGWWGRYQKLQFLMTMLPVTACAFHVMSVVFIGRTIDHKCAPLDSLNVSVHQDGVWRSYDVMKSHDDLNLTVTFGTCNIDVTNGSETLLTSKCTSGYEYSEPVDRSFVSQWDLVCERESLSDVSQTVLSLGQMVGAFFFTALADKFGRKPIYMITNLIFFIIAIVIAFSPSFTVFVILRFFLGASQQGTGLVSAIMLVEILPKKRRALPCEVGNFAWVGSLMLLCLITYLARDISWVYTELIFAATSAFCLVQWWLTDESLRWLVINKREKEIQRVLEKAARANKVDVEKIRAIMAGRQPSLAMTPVTVSTLSYPSDKQDTNLGLSEVPEKKEVIFEISNSVLSQTEHRRDVSLSAFVTNKRIMFITAISCFMWFTDSVTYYGLLMTSSSLANNLYLGVFLSVVAEVPTCILFIFFIDRLGRKWGLIVSHILTAAALLSATVLANVPAAENIPGLQILILCATLVGKFGVSTAFAILWLYSAELFPTNIRNTGFGLSSLAARIGGMLAPFSRTLSRHVPWGPGAFFSVLCLLVPILMRFLPETAGEELPQTLEDLEKWFKTKEKKRAGESVISCPQVPPQ